MSEIPAPQKPIPQFTIRWMLGLMTVWAVIFSIVALAMRGHYWALAITVGVGALVLFMIVGASLFSLVWLFSGFGSSRNSSAAGQSPFRDPIRPRPEEFLTDGE
jgi:hypothetical protein